VASLPLSLVSQAAHSMDTQTGAHRPDLPDKGLAIMELAILAFFVLIALASIAGLTTDSRDGADWAPTAGGRRVDHWH
jgi:hypothetical protein